MNMESIIWYIIVAMLGASIGSFTTMLVYRLHKKVSIGLSRSQCPACKHMLEWFELIPLLSFLFLKGKCRNCRKPIPIRYFLIELTTKVLFLYAWYVYVHSSNPSVLLLVRDWFVIFVTVFTFFYDLLYLEVSLPVMIGGGITAAFLYLLSLPSDWKSIAGGMILGVGWFGIQHIISRGRWIGGGDILIGFFMGATLGFTRTIVALGIAYVVGGLWGIALLLTRKKERGDQIAFGTFLALGTLVALWWGSDILGWYQNILRLAV